ncbi:hypothetical protein A3E66_04400 [Candidatus Daviesbacteria bacterium RIFCSPHIGHO2_12_FULL_37_16]|uniref:Glycosyltransferase n=2 Tax=Candidatus Daviesiibacteriota TaxID=1752718 RepID=A0A1F5K413_9BACT|nr:MAG: hypothetical protein A3E66_04400 [Candidatus Daviesbacteria bacterium RIFCSPHIGHO2_12_FULL_37_16]
MNKTILYYTSNHEDPVFEQKIIDSLLENCGNLPIVSVSQKPIKLGQNICVGEVGQSYVNEWRQILIGAKVATTEYLIMAESDFLYPPEYFQFKPKDENIYRYDNIWIMWLEKDEKYKHYNFHRKHYSEGAQIVRREYFINLLEKYLEQFPDWYNKSYNELKSRISPYYYESYTFFHGENPCISMKTRNGTSSSTGILHGKPNISKNLPYWGNVNDLRSKFL